MGTPSCVHAQWGKGGGGRRRGRRRRGRRRREGGGEEGGGGKEEVSRKKGGEEKEMECGVEINILSSHKEDYNKDCIQRSADARKTKGSVQKKQGVG